MNQQTTTVPWWRVQFTEADALSAADAIRHEHLSLGSITADFESKLAEALSVPHVVATTSGSVSILMALIALGIGPGDEVIVPNRTWIAAAHAVMMLGAKVVLVDVLSDIPNMDPFQIEQKINSRTKVIMPTALNGRAVDMEAINRLGKKHSVHIVEDAAQALFSQCDGKYIGTQSVLGCFSLSVAKLIPTGQGGFVATSDKSLYQELRKIRTHGVSDLFSCDFTRFGFNFRYTDLQASIGLTQLAKKDEKIAAMRQIYLRYENTLKDFTSMKLIPVAIENGEVPLYIEVLCPNRQDLMNYLDSRNIQYKGFYPNLNRAKYFNNTDTFANADVFESQGITLPCGPDQSISNIEFVLEALSEFENLSANNTKIIKIV